MNRSTDSLKNIGRIVIDDGTGELTSDSNKLIGILRIDDGSAIKTSDSPKLIGRVRVWDGVSPVIKTSDSDLVRGCVTIDDGTGIKTSDSRKIRGTVVLQGYSGGGPVTPVIDVQNSEGFGGGFSNLFLGNNQKTGTLFTSTGGKLHHATMYLQRTGAPPGNCYCHILSALDFSVVATSDPVATSTLPTAVGAVDFAFSGANQIDLVNGTRYGIVAYYIAGGDGSNLIAGSYGSKSSWPEPAIVMNAAGGWTGYDTLTEPLIVYVTR